MLNRLINIFKKDKREKIFYRNHNAILNDVIPYFSPVKMEKAKAVVLWADVRGRLRELSLQAKMLKKPLIIVQHGRGCVRDYLPPLKAEFLADRFCAWGPMDETALLDIGIDRSRIVLTGAPIFDGVDNTRHLSEVPHIVFAPFHFTHDVEENFALYDELSRIKGIKVTCKLLRNAHDVKRYGKNVVITDQWENDPLQITYDLMRKTDILVSNSIGTHELIAMYFNIPIIHIDNVIPREFLGSTAESFKEQMEIFKISGVSYAKELKDLPGLIEMNLKDPDKLKSEREKELYNSAGIGLRKTPVLNIRNVILGAINNEKVIDIK